MKANVQQVSSIIIRCIFGSTICGHSAYWCKMPRYVDVVAFISYTVLASMITPSATGTRNGVVAQLN